MKIGIVGGTFYPIHKGHLMLAEYAKKEYHLDKIWFMPNKIPPHKSNASIEAMMKHRVEMVKLAIGANPDYVLQPYEVEHTDVSYSYRTLEHFRETYPRDTFYFIIGADSLFAIESWVKPERILKSCVILAAFRDGKNLEEMQRQISYLNEKYGGDIRLLHTPNTDVSSTDIRRRLRCGETVGGMVPKEVETYMKEQHLFQGEV